MINVESDFWVRIQALERLISQLRVRIVMLEAQISAQSQNISNLGY